MSRSRRVLPIVLILLLLLGAGGALTWVATSTGEQDAAPGAAGEAGSQEVGVAPGRGDDQERRAARAHVTVSTGSSSAELDSESPGAGDESAADTEGAGADKPTSGIGAAAGAVPGQDDRMQVRGRVVDGATGEVLADARVLVVRRDQSWNGTRTDEGGAFVGRVPEDLWGGGALVELRIGKPGYRTQVIPWREGPLDVRLLPEDHLPRPGAIEGLATDPQGRGVEGRVLLTTYDEMGDHHGLWAMADAAGSFRLEGVAPGWWRMRLVGGDSWSEVIVPDGGTARVHVTGGAEAWPGKMTEVEFRKRRADLSKGRPPGVTDEKLSDAQRDALAWQRAMAMQDLEARWRGIRPTRSVVVTGLPEDASAYLRAATTQGPNHSWRVRVVDGVARFAGLTAERWQLILEVPGEQNVSHPIDLREPETEPGASSAATGDEAGDDDGPVTFPWPL